MCFFSSPSPPPPPQRSDADVQGAALAERRRAYAARGRASTILTGGAGDASPAPVAAKALLGQ